MPQLLGYLAIRVVITAGQRFAYRYSLYVYTVLTYAITSLVVCGVGEFGEFGE